MSEDSIFNIVLASMLVVFGLAFAIILLFKISQRRILEEQKEAYEKELALKEELLISNIATQEKERTRIAKDLHDDLGSKLNVVSLNIRLLKDTLEKGKNVDNILSSIKSVLNSSIETTREISHNLMPAVLVKFGVQSAISSLVTSINKSGRLNIEFSFEEEWTGLSETAELHLFRIIQELTTNTIKHARAKNIYIVSKVTDDGLVISYRDDGIGIQGKGIYHLGLGMANIVTRCQLINAEFKLDSEIKKGMQIDILFKSYNTNRPK